MDNPHNIPPSLLDYSFIDFHLENPISSERRSGEDEDGYFSIPATISLDYKVAFHKEIEERYYFFLTAHIKMDTSSVKAEIAGIFQFDKESDEDYRKKMIRLQGISTLYGILRGGVCMLTTTRPIMLPNVMVADVVNEIERRKREEEKSSADGSEQN